MLGLRLSRRPPDRKHPFGHGNNVYFWAFVVSMMLFTVGGAFAIREGIHRLREPTLYGRIGRASRSPQRFTATVV